MRGLSLLCAALAYLGVPAWTYLRVQSGAGVPSRVASLLGGYANLGVYLFSVLLAGIVSGVGLVLGVLAWRTLATPRPKWRLVELSMIAAPFVMALTTLLSLIA